MDLVFVTDVARANILALQADVTDEVFNVGTGVQTTLRQLCDALLRLQGSILQPDYHPARTVANVRARKASTAKAEKLLGFRAEMDLDGGLRELIRWRATLRGQVVATIS
jgi:UDP-glucose 4-epimerase